MSDVGLITAVPLTNSPVSGRVWRASAAAAGLEPADPRDRWKADLDVVTSGYFQAMGIPVVRGRNFLPSDRFTDAQLQRSPAPRQGVVVVNATFASAYFGSEDPIGQAIAIGDDREFGARRTIVGVVADVRASRIADPPVPAVFIPFGQHPDVLRPSLVVRSALPLHAVAPALRARIETYDPELLVLQLRSMEAVVSGALSRPRFNLLLLASFAGVALMLGAVGIYGLMASLVTQRTREIGIRMALGARPPAVVRLMLRDCLRPVGAGALAGLGASLIAARLLRSLLFGVPPLDPLSFVAAAAVLIAVALAACYVPTRRAVSIDPPLALRNE